MGDSVELFPPENRAEHFRELANQANIQAQATFDRDRRAELLAMAASWHSLTVEAERAIRAAVASEFAQEERQSSAAASSLGTGARDQNLP
jgi:hypothetical protein